MWIVTNNLKEREFDSLDSLMQYLEGYCGGQNKTYKFYEYYIKGGCKLIDMRNLNGLLIERKD